ncbi:unnamed protein product [Parnassius mnemosyne]|uniref:Endonuclease/exonuclease/phosphatase domain-containing protein n=1 Tax=Parnassius mnemosyne TaxID=213953 RepID=A0AAV1KLM5_9NEOP
MATTKSKSLRVGLYNAGSIRSKSDEFQAALLCESADIMAINETWLRAGEDASALLVPGYRFSHIPRSCNLSRARGGGVGFYVKRGINARSYSHNIIFEEVEQQWLSLSINKVKLLIGTAYRPQWVNVEKFFDSLTDILTSYSNFDNIILLGDFNINILDESDNKTQQLNQFLQYTRLKNCIFQPTHFTQESATLIDLVMTDASVTNTRVKYTPELGGHAIILVDFKIKKPKVAIRQQIIRPIKNINLSDFESEVESINWDSITRYNYVNDMVSVFSKRILELFDKHAPEKLITIRKKQLPWFTSNVKYIMQLRDDAHNKYRRTKTEKDKIQYKTLKSLVNSSLYAEKKAYFDYHINQHLHNTNVLWKNLKSFALPSFKNSNDLPEHFSDPDEINRHFLSIPGTNNIVKSFNVRNLESRNCISNTFRLIPVHENVVAKIIMGIKSNAQGVERINMDMIILTLPRTLNVITAIINKSITESVFPSSWKTALIRPIPKKSNPTNVNILVNNFELSAPNNYRHRCDMDIKHDLCFVHVHLKTYPLGNNIEVIEHSA